MVERSPILLQELWALGPPLRRVQRLGLLGPGLLLGDLPRDATHAWPAVTPQQVFATPDAVVAAGLHGDTLCWLLRPRRLLGRSPARCVWDAPRTMTWWFRMRWWAGGTRAS